MSHLKPVKLPVTKPLAVCTDSTAQVIPNNASTVLSFNTNEDLQGITKATSGTGHSFTVTSSGLYYIESVCVFADVTAAANTRYCGLTIVKNGVGAHIGPRTILSKLDAGDAYFATACAQKVLILKTGDVVTIEVYQNSGATNTTGNHKLTMYQVWAFE
jgi:aspartate 1-decarboxylase